MKARITVGPVDLRTEGLTLTTRDIARLMRQAAGIALAVIEQAGDDREPPPNPVGFTAIVERATENDNDVLD